MARTFYIMPTVRVLNPFIIACPLLLRPKIEILIRPADVDYNNSFIFCTCGTRPNLLIIELKFSMRSQIFKPFEFIALVNLVRK